MNFGNIKAKAIAKGINHQYFFKFILKKPQKEVNHKGQKKERSQSSLNFCVFPEKNQISQD